MQQPQTYILSRFQRKMACVSMQSTWHATATDLLSVKVSEKDGLCQHAVHMACNSHRLTLCQGVRERWPGSAWSPHGMQQPQTYILSRCQRKMAWVSMESTWHAAATDLPSVKVSEKDGLGQHGVHVACSSHRLTLCQGVRESWPGSAWSPHGMQQPQTYPLSRCQRKMAWVSMESTWHAAATDLLPVKVSEKDGLGQHGVHMACSSHRLTSCQGVRERWPGSAWSPHGIQQPQAYSLSRCQRKMAWVSMESTWHAAATDLPSVKVSEKVGLGQHGVHMACSSHRLTICQGVRESWPGSAWSPHGMQQPQTYHLSRCQRKLAWVSMESTWHAAATDLPPVKVSEKVGLGQHGVHMACSSHRLTTCQGVRESWPGSAWSPHGMQQPQTYHLSRCQRKMAWVSMESTWHAAATDLPSVKVSEKDGLGQPGVHMACSSHRLTTCQGVRESWP